MGVVGLSLSGVGPSLWIGTESEWSGCSGTESDEVGLMLKSIICIQPGAHERNGLLKWAPDTTHIPHVQYMHACVHAACYNGRLLPW